MLRRKFPVNDEEAKAYGGFMQDDYLFCCYFSFKNGYEDSLEAVNRFLFENGFFRIALEEVDREFNFENQILSLSKHENLEKLVLSIKNPNRVFEMSQVIQRILEFRNERDWEQFHNSKDLALAISIEASELLELFLWKEESEVNESRLQDELADIFSFCILLSEKHNLNIPEIIIKKIEKNALKYPIDKAKGTSRKYNEI